MCLCVMCVCAYMCVMCATQQWLRKQHTHNMSGIVFIRKTIVFVLHHPQKTTYLYMRERIYLYTLMIAIRRHQAQPIYKTINLHIFHVRLCSVFFGKDKALLMTGSCSADISLLRRKNSRWFHEGRRQCHTPEVNGREGEGQHVEKSCKPAFRTFLYSFDFFVVWFQ